VFSADPDPHLRAKPLTLGIAASASARARRARRIGAHLTQHRSHDAVGLIQQRLEQVLGLDLR
jgi:hypothetical protein